jgi:hypothetical protein
VNARELFDACVDERIKTRDAEGTYAFTFNLGPYRAHLRNDKDNLVFQFTIDVDGGEVVVQGTGARRNGSGDQFDWIKEPTPVQIMKLRLYL